MRQEDARSMVRTFEPVKEKIDAIRSLIENVQADSRRFFKGMINDSDLPEASRSSTCGTVTEPRGNIQEAARR